LRRKEWKKPKGLFCRFLKNAEYALSTSIIASPICRNFKTNEVFCPLLSKIDLGAPKKQAKPALKKGTT
jgi:hypothetical protein